MGRLTELFDIVANGFNDPEEYHFIETRDEKTRDLLKEARRINKKADFEERTLF